MVCLRASMLVDPTCLAPPPTCAIRINISTHTHTRTHARTQAGPERASNLEARPGSASNDFKLQGQQPRQ
eukprot:11547534-Alexandrium_andersonii.AAC.1